MTRAFEDRVTYNQAREAVAVVTLTVECHPKQVQSVTDFLIDVRDKAGVYAVDFEHDVRIPEAPKPEIIEGEAHGEQQLQSADSDSAEGAGERSESAAVEPAAELDAAEDRGLAGTAGEGGAGSVGGSDESERLPEV